MSLSKSCQQCKNSYKITDKDLEFYKKVSPKFGDKICDIPPPKLCPDCRQQRRLAFRNERNLCKRKCDLCSKETISIYDENVKFPVYCSECWWSDNWDDLEHGVDFDFSKTFFEQFHELRKKTPHIALQVGNNENSKYINLSGYNKNCHLIFAAEYNEDCLHGTQVIKCESCVDTLNCLESKYCYEVIDVVGCYELHFSENCKNCHESMFLYDCHGCSNCIFCSNLRNKKYHIFNKEYSKEEFYKKQKEIFEVLNSKDAKKLEEDFIDLKNKSFHKYLNITNSENNLGDFLTNCNNAEICFDLAYGEDCKYVYTGFQVKDLFDVCHTTEAELCIEGVSIGYKSYGALFSALSWSSNNPIYSYNINSCTGTFGSANLKRGKNIILNKQYTKEEYEKLVPKIIEHMIRTNEWGEFFPVKLSPFTYNETVAQEYFPLTNEEVLKRDWQWKTQKDQIPKVTKIIPAEKLPDDIKNIPDDILSWAIKCEKTGRPFKIQKAELEFYRKMNLPIPHFHPDQRHENRMSKRNPRKLWERKCSGCNTEIKTTFSPENSSKILCEDCYLKEIN